MSMMSDLKGISIQQYKTDIGFRTLVEGVNENLYIIPKYQRKYRWSKEQIISLVESLIRGLPIPPIYTCRNSENQLEILDGQQRVLSLFFYYIGFYCLYTGVKTLAFQAKPLGQPHTSKFRKKKYRDTKLEVKKWKTIESQHIVRMISNIT